MGATGALDSPGPPNAPLECAVRRVSAHEQTFSGGIRFTRQVDSQLVQFGLVSCGGMCVMWTSHPRNSSRLSIAPWAARSAELHIKSIAEPADLFGYGGGLTGRYFSLSKLTLIRVIS
jgi:hypothetical protein